MTKEILTSAAAQYEHHHDVESLQAFARKAIATSLKQLLTKKNVRWTDLRALMAMARLQLEKADTGGYTVFAVNQQVRVNASDVFRGNFSGKENREATERILGLRVAPAVSEFHDEAYQQPHDVSHHKTHLEMHQEVHRRIEYRQAEKQHIRRAPDMREQRRAERHAARASLKNDYEVYRKQKLIICKDLTEAGMRRKQEVSTALRHRKKQIRASNEAWAAKKILLSQAAAQTVLDLHIEKIRHQEQRQVALPQSYRVWVGDKAEWGDPRAAAQLRGWHYADQRNQRRLGAQLEPDALHISGAMGDEEPACWSDVAKDRISAHQRSQLLEQPGASTRIWTIGRKSGDVSYALNGKAAIVDRGRIITVLNRDEAAIVFGLEMAIKKYGPTIACTGSNDWKREVAAIGVRHGVSVQYSDPQMQQMQREAMLVRNRRVILGWYTIPGTAIRVVVFRGHLPVPGRDIP